MGFDVFPTSHLCFSMNGQDIRLMLVASPVRRSKKAQSCSDLLVEQPPAQQPLAQQDEG